MPPSSTRCSAILPVPIFPVPITLLIMSCKDAAASICALCCQASLQSTRLRRQVVSLCADLEGARAGAKSKAAKKNAARKAKKAVEGNPASVESVTNGLASTRYIPSVILRYNLLTITCAAVPQHYARNLSPSGLDIYG